MQLQYIAHVFAVDFKTALEHAVTTLLQTSFELVDVYEVMDMDLAEQVEQAKRFAIRDWPDLKNARLEVYVTAQTKAKSLLRATPQALRALAEDLETREEFHQS